MKVRIEVELDDETTLKLEQEITKQFISESKISLNTILESIFDDMRYDILDFVDKERKGGFVEGFLDDK